MEAVPGSGEIAIPITLSAADVAILDNLRGALSREGCLALLLRIARTEGIASLGVDSGETQSLRMQVANLTLLLKREMALTERLKTGKPEGPAA